MMRSRSWDAVVISGTDPHDSEYQAPRWHQVAWLSGYTGEGDLVVTLDTAGLWTDTRYFIQAGKQLPGSGVELHKTRVPEQVLIPEWLSDCFHDAGDVVVAVDGRSQSASSVAGIKAALGDDASIVSVPDLLDSLWKDRPAVPSTPVITIGEAQAGRSRADKIAWLRSWLAERDLDAILVTALDDIAWMLNVRGQDIDYNPVVLSYLLLGRESVRWFARKDSVDALDSETEDSFRELEEDGVSVEDYSGIGLALSEFMEDDGAGRLYVDTDSLNYELYGILAPGGARDARLVAGPSPIILEKAMKNEVEIEGMREAHIEDGLAMEKFLYWLETSLAAGVSVTERDALEKLGDLRREIPGFRGESFETISAYEANAALPHYVTPEEGSAEIFPQGLYLCDSGGQYVFGTTDITRTVPVGPCDALEREDYTLVLKGHVDLAKAIFPKGTAGCQIDALSRAPLWSRMRNFGHGTGHGVGFYLNVHEGPQDIRQNFNKQSLLPGMVTSDEPGIYREGRFGIRHENLLLTVDAGTNEFGSWLGFETLTLCHFDTSAIVRDLLDQSEIDWLNAYNSRVAKVLSPRLPSEIATWLRKKTLPI